MFYKLFSCFAFCSLDTSSLQKIIKKICKDFDDIRHLQFRNIQQEQLQRCLEAQIVQLLPQVSTLNSQIILEGVVLDKLRKLHDQMIKALKLNYYKKIKMKTLACLRGLRKLLNRRYYTTEKSPENQNLLPPCFDDTSQKSCKSQE